MIVKPLKVSLTEYLKRHQLEKKYEKAKKLLEYDMHHPSLNLELLEPKHLKVYSFRVDRKYRVLFIVRDGEIEVLTITNHYK